MIKKILLIIFVLLTSSCSKHPSDVVVSFVVREKDLEGIHIVNEDTIVDSVNVIMPYNSTLLARGYIPEVQLEEGWHLDSYMIDDAVIDEYNLKSTKITTDTIVYICGYPDFVGEPDENDINQSKYNPDGKDDRLYHIVQFISREGKVIYSTTVEDGQKISTPTHLRYQPEINIDGLVFKGWSSRVSEEVYKDTIIGPVYDEANTSYDVTYVVRAIDPGRLSFNHKRVSIKAPLGELPELILTDEDIYNGWRLDKIYLNNYPYTEEELMDKTITSDTIIEYRLIQDVKDGE